MSFVAIIFFVLFLFVLLFSYTVSLKSNNKLLISAILFIVVFLILLGLTLHYSIIQLDKVDDYDELGPYGDYIGGILNPLIAVFAVFAAGFAFYAQYQANMLVQEQFEKQQKKDHIQDFENKLFNLLNIHHQIISDIDIDSAKIFHHQDELKEFIEENEMVKKTYSSEIITDDKYTSRDVFKYVFNILDYLLSIDMWINDDIDYATENIEDIKKFNLIFDQNFSLKYKETTRDTKFPQIYNTIYSLVNTDLGHYFRNLYNIVKFIDGTHFSEDEVEDYKIKYSYLSILRAQLSDAELKILFLNCIYYYGNEKFKPLLEKYSFFKIIPIDSDDDNIFNIYYKFYEKVAFCPLKNNDDIRFFLNIYKFQKIEISKIEHPEIELQP